MICLFVGRFQPFHNGHLQDVKDALRFSKKVIIGIGSSQESGTELNPFSYAQRKEMIELALAEANISHVEIIPIPDINDDKQWVGHVKKVVGTFDVVYTGNEKTKLLFGHANIPVRTVRFLEGVTGTLTREKMQQGQDWKALVPPAVATYISKTI